MTLHIRYVLNAPVGRSLCRAGTQDLFYRMTEPHRNLQQKSVPTLNQCFQTQQQKKVLNYEHFLNEKSKRRKPSALRELTKKLTQMPAHTIPLSTGAPNVNTFPFQALSVSLRDGSHFTVDGKDLEVALQYSPSSGIPKFVKQLQQLQDRIHGPQDWSCSGLMTTSGSMEGMSAVCGSILDEGDVVILPVPVYAGTADLLRAMNLEYIKLQQDKDGADPQQLHSILQDRVLHQKPMPKMMYVNPIACNPTGRNLSVERKGQFYRLACEYDFLILEDDPYYFIQYEEETLPSFLSLDKEGRVIRLDSFSKVLSSGLRLGYLTGPAQIVRQVELHIQTSTMHASSLSQVMISKLLDHWGFDHFFAHIDTVKAFYRERRDLMVAACERHLRGLCEWDVPQGGMFLWLQVPSLRDTMDLATKHCVERFLLVVPGHPFSGKEEDVSYNYIRVSFSQASPSQIEQGTQLLGQVIQEVKNKKIIQ